MSVGLTLLQDLLRDKEIYDFLKELVGDILPPPPPDVEPTVESAEPVCDEPEVTTTLSEENLSNHPIITTQKHLMSTSPSPTYSFPSESDEEIGISTESDSSNSSNIANSSVTSETHDQNIEGEDNLSVNGLLQQPAVPPLFIRQKSIWKALKYLCNKHLINIKSFRKSDEGVKVTMSTYRDLGAILKLLKEKNMSFHIYTPSDRRLLRVIIRNIPIELTCEEIKASLAENFPVHEVYHLGRRSNEIVVVTLDKTEKSPEILKLQTVCGIKGVQVEMFNRRRWSKCLNCQSYEHSTSNCSTPIKIDETSADNPITVTGDEVHEITRQVAQVRLEIPCFTVSDSKRPSSVPAQQSSKSSSLTQCISSQTDHIEEAETSASKATQATEHSTFAVNDTSSDLTPLIRFIKEVDAPELCRIHELIRKSDGNVQEFVEICMKIPPLMDKLSNFRIIPIKNELTRTQLEVNSSTATELSSGFPTSKDSNNSTKSEAPVLKTNDEDNTFTSSSVHNKSALSLVCESDVSKSASSTTVPQFPSAPLIQEDIPYRNTKCTSSQTDPSVKDPRLSVSKATQKPESLFSANTLSSLELVMRFIDFASVHIAELDRINQRLLQNEGNVPVLIEICLQLVPIADRLSTFQ